MVESYSFESLEKITPSKIYELFTGMKPITVKVESLKNTEELFELLNFYSSMTPILHSLNVCEIIKVVSVEKDEIKLQNPNSKYSHTIRAD